MVEMVSGIERVKAEVLKKITPSESEKRKVLSLADKLTKRVKTAAKKADVEATVRVEGSVAKDTWLRGEPEIDIFMQLPTSTPREVFKATCLNIAKEATKGSRQVERFAEHPYLEAFVGSTRINIVPCYRAKPGEWLSATDRTPYHTDFVKPKLNDSLRNEIRLLKRFMKGIGVYGAEIKVGGFSGYLCELLVLHYSTFINVLEAAAAWKNPWTLDFAAHYRGRENEIMKIYKEPLVLIDPVDKGRNVASAVRQERLMEFVAASRQFLKHPSQDFFFPPSIKAFTEKQLIKNMKARDTALVFVKFGTAKTVPDVLWGQLYRTKRSLHRMIDQNDFYVVNDAVWSDEQNLNLFIFELENRFLPLSKKHWGPPIEKRDESESFLRKHLDSPSTVSGPRLENDRWVVDIKRKQVDIVRLLRDSLKHGGVQRGVAGFVSKAMRKSMEILANEEIMKTYLSNRVFAEFLTEYMKGKPRWLQN